MKIPVTDPHQILKRLGVRYLIVGGSVYIYEVAIILIAQHLGATAVEAVAISFWSALLVSFGLQKIVTFGDKRVHHRILLPQFIAYSLLVAFNFGFTILITKLLTPVIPAVLTRTIALGLTTIWNFYLYRTRVFKSSTGTVQ